MALAARKKNIDNIIRKCMFLMADTIRGHPCNVNSVSILHFGSMVCEDPSQNTRSSAKQRDQRGGYAFCCIVARGNYPYRPSFAYFQ